MRKKQGTAPAEDAEVNMTPMLDIVFIMLIFFIVTATFVKETGLDVSRPDTEENKPTKPAKTILIQINKDNEIYIQRRIVDIRAVRANIERLRAENPKSAVLIQAEREATTGILVTVMDQARLAHAPVSIAPLQNE